MKKLLLIAMCWFLFAQGSRTIDLWVVVHIDGIATVKVKRDFYYEYLELSMQSEKNIRTEYRKYCNDVQAYKRWEKIGKHENHY